ncbi:hypothetical protein [Deinococcus apachensis]|uniref:hypothetical protein n=1 Tax=Deinococcus apachensis TaxID=309886 RepID=UPI0003657D13|nr:hypothetical protein [Deinococcus apachensis]
MKLAHLGRGALTALLLPLLPAPSPALAQPVALPCGGVIAARTINGDIEVPQGRVCTLRNLQVNGEVRVERGASLTVQNTRIAGDLRAGSGFARLTVRSSVVTGRLAAQGGGAVDIRDARVEGDLRLERNAGTLRLSRLTILGNLECLNNARAPSGTSLGVDGEQTGQCRTL